MNGNLGWACAEHMKSQDRIGVNITRWLAQTHWAKRPVSALYDSVAMNSMKLVQPDYFLLHLCCLSFSNQTQVNLVSYYQMLPLVILKNAFEL